MTTNSLSRLAAPVTVSRRLRLPAALLIAASLKGALLAAGVVPFNGDEAVVALMARHILQGARPVFYYGQAYMGSLDAWLVAGAFSLMGESVLAVRLVQVLLHLGLIATTYWLARTIYRSEWIAGAAAVFLAIPPVLVTLYSTATLGNYGEVLLLGNLLLLLTLHVVQAPLDTAGNAEGSFWSSRAGQVIGWLLLGGLAGVGFWSMSLIGVYVLPVLAYAGAAQRRQPARLAAQAGLFALGFAAGAAPWLAYTFQNGMSTVGAGLGAGMPVPEGYHPVFAPFRHVFYFLLLGLSVLWGMRPPWSAEFLALPLLPYALALHIGVVIVAVRRVATLRDRAAPGRWLVMSCALVLVLAYILTPYGEDPSGRYFLPLAVPMALFTAEMLQWLRLRRRRRRSAWRKWFAQILALVLVAFYWLGNVQVAADYPPGLTTQFSPQARIDQRGLPALIDFLRANDESRGYTNYWVAYPLAYLSGETLIFAAGLPYHADLSYTARDLRYPAYTQAVEASPKAAYITANHAALDQALQRGLAEQEVGYREAWIGDFHVFYALSRKVTPEELKLGTACCPP